MVILLPQNLKSMVPEEVQLFVRVLVGELASTMDFLRSKKLHSLRNSLLFAFVAMKVHWVIL